MSRARDSILTAAKELFYAGGTRAVGVDAVIARSGVAKATLYNHFPTKDALIVAYLDGRPTSWRREQVPPAGPALHELARYLWPAYGEALTWSSTRVRVR